MNTCVPVLLDDTWLLPASMATVDAVRIVVNGQTLFSGHVMQMALGSRSENPAAVINNNQGSLTERESEVLSFLAEGHSNREIATCLNIPISAVQNHLTATYGKLDARSRSEAVIQAARRGIIVLDESSD